MNVRVSSCRSNGMKWSWIRTRNKLRYKRNYRARNQRDNVERGSQRKLAIKKSSCACASLSLSSGGSRSLSLSLSREDDSSPGAISRDSSECPVPLILPMSLARYVRALRRFTTRSCECAKLLCARMNCPGSLLIVPPAGRSSNLSSSLSM